MKSFNLAMRRTHLYLGMLLIPWVFVYAFSTLIFNHRAWFEAFQGGPADWVHLWEKDYELDLPRGNPELRALGAHVLEEHGIRNVRYGVRRNGQRLDINVQRFMTPMRLIYHGPDKKLVAEERKTMMAEVFIRLHVRHGWGQSGLLQKMWSLAVDVTCVAILAWILTGLYLWWKISQTRLWGFAALAAGFLSFFGLLLLL